MKMPTRWLLVSLIAAPGALPASTSLAHDPRTTARELSQGLTIEGVGQIALDYRALHFNPEMYERARKTPDFMGMLNERVWGRMGRAVLGFDLVSGPQTFPAGEYELGINMTADEEFSVVLWRGDDKAVLPLAVERDQGPVPYLTIALLATDEPDTFVLEARCGPYRGTAPVKVPALAADHTHAP